MGKEIKSPIIAIRNHCRECQGELGEVTISEHLEILKRVSSCEACESHYTDGWYCKLWEYRLGKTERGNYPEITPLKAIKLNCLECVETVEDLKNCFCNGEHECNGRPNYKCNLYEFRLGKNPFTRTGKTLSEEERNRRRENIKLLHSGMND